MVDGNYITTKVEGIIAKHVDDLYMCARNKLAWIEEFMRRSGDDKLQFSLGCRELEIVRFQQIQITLELLPTLSARISDTRHTFGLWQRPRPPRRPSGRLRTSGPGPGWQTARRSFRDAIAQRPFFFNSTKTLEIVQDIIKQFSLVNMLNDRLTGYFGMTTSEP